MWDIRQGPLPQGRVCNTGAVSVQDLLPGAELGRFAPFFYFNSFLDGNEEGGVKSAPPALAYALLKLADHRAAFWVMPYEVVQVLCQLWVLVEVFLLLGECIMDSLRLGCPHPLARGCSTRVTARCSCCSRIFLAKCGCLKFGGQMMKFAAVIAQRRRRWRTFMLI